MPHERPDHVHMRQFFPFLPLFPLLLLIFSLCVLILIFLILILVPTAYHHTVDLHHPLLRTHRQHLLPFSFFILDVDRRDERKLERVEPALGL